MNWNRVEEILKNAIADEVCTAIAAAVDMPSIGKKTFYSGAANEESFFDLASLTKVLAATTLIAQWEDARQYILAEKIPTHLRNFSWRPEWEEVTWGDVLIHRAGFPKWIDLRKGGIGSIASLAPQYSPRSATLYSDLGFILLGERIAQVGEAPLDLLVKKNIAKPLSLTLTYNPLKAGIRREKIVATEIKPERGGRLQGEVDDDNCDFMGGVAAHAGLFGTLADVMKIGSAWRDAREGIGTFLSPATALKFTSVRKRGKEGMRPLGWDIATPPHSTAGKKVSPDAIGHAGFTGTSLWIDPTRKAVVVLLTNRVYFGSENRKIDTLRPAFHDAVWEAIAS